MTLPFTVLVASGGSIPFWVPIVMIGFGVLLFVFGFSKYREYRILADTPVIPVRSAPMGLVHVSGQSTGGNPLISPLTQVPCYYYEVKVEKQVKRNDREEWESVNTEKIEVPFYLQDTTGKVLVNPQRAEYDVPRSFWGELRPRSILSFGSAPRKVDPSLSVAAPTDEHLWAYMNGQFSQARAAIRSSGIPGAQVMDKALGVIEGMQAMGVSIGAGGVSMDFGNHTYRLTEHCLPAGRACNIMGTCEENPTPTDEHDRNLIKRGENEKTFLITTKTEKQIEKSLRLQALVMVLIGAALIVGGVAVTLHRGHML